MATHKSAAKRARQAERRTARNQTVRTNVRTVVRNFREALGAGDAKAAKSALDTATRTVQKAATKGVMHKRTAARRVSRLMKAMNAAAK